MHRFITKGITFLIMGLFAFLQTYSQYVPVEHSHLEYVENKNQFHPNCLYKADITNGAVFLEKDGLTFNFYRYSDFAHLKKFGQGEAIPESVKNREERGIGHYHAYKATFEGANPAVQLSGSNKCKDYKNYFLGNDPSKWASNVPQYKVVEYKELYPKINLKLYSEEYSMKYDFVVQPGGNPEDIRIRYDGQESIELKDGELIIQTSVNQIKELKPYAYQLIDKDTIAVSCEYQLNKNVVRFKVGKYNKSYPLIIDPTLIFSTYTGSTVDNWGFTATFDRYGNGYSGGIVNGVGYPVSLGAFQINFGGGESGPSGWYAAGWDVGIIKYNETGTQRLWATYLGGNSSDMPHSLVINSFNELVILGTTGSSNFPMLPSSYDNTFNGGHHLYYDNVITFGNGSDIFVAKLSGNGASLLGSTYVGGSDNDGLNFREYYENNIMNGNDSLYYNYADGARGEVICDNVNNVYVGTCTFSSDFPVTPNAFQPTHGGKQDGVVFKLDANLSNLVWSSYIGGSEDDAVYSIDVNSAYDLYLCGGTVSPNFPVTPGAYKTNYMGKVDAFVSHVSRSGNVLLNSTFYGSNQYDQSYFIRTDKYDYVYIYGQTRAPGSTLVYNAQYSRPNSGQFLAEFNPELSQLIWSTVFGSGNGVPNITPTAFSVDICNRIYVAGSGRDWTGNPSLGTNGMPVTVDAYQHTTDGQDFYIMVIRDDASNLEYATFFGENRATGCGSDHVDGGTSRFDKKGNIYQSVCASCGGCDNFPVTPGAWSSSNNATNCNNALFKFKIFYDFAIADFEVPGVVCAPAVVTPINYSMGTSYQWNFGDGSPIVTDSFPSHLYTTPGTYNISLIITTPWACNIGDTLVKQITVLGNSSQTLPPKSICPGENIQIGLPPSSDPTIQYTWTPTTALSDPNVSNPFASPTQNTNYTLLVSNGVCTDTIRQSVIVYNIDFNNHTYFLCKNDSVVITANSSSPFDQYIWSHYPDFSDTINSNNLNASSITLYPQNSMTVWVSGKASTCNDVDSIKINVSQLSVQLVDSIPISCHGLCDAAASVNLVAGFAPTAYSWNNGSTSLSLSSLCQGTYIFTATDSLGCKGKVTAVFTEPPLLQTTLTDLHNTTCSSTCIGTATILVNGGTPGYTYNWPDGQTDSIGNALCAGTYIVTVSDARGCKDTIHVAITDSSTLTTSTSRINVRCFGECNGQAQVFPAYGTPPYTYLWSNGSTTSQITNLCPGIYNVKVTDQDSCSRINFITITEPQLLLPVRDTVIHNPCYHYCNGKIEVSATGGTPHYAYQWNNSSHDSVLTNLCSGTYIVTITDANQCKTVDTLVITEPTQLVVRDSALKTICTQACNGFAMVIPSGSVPPYQYLWNNGKTTQSVSGLCQGNYYVTVTDSNQCRQVVQIYVGNNYYRPPINVWSNKDTLFVGQSAQLNANPGSGYSYQWTPVLGLSDPTIPNPTATPVITTQYILQITDSRGCINYDTLRIIVSDVNCDETEIFVPNAFTPNKDGKNDVLYVRGPMIEELYFTIYNRWGEKVFETDDITKGWDGTYKDREADPAVFVYYLKAKCYGGKEFFKKGNITLIR